MNLRQPFIFSCFLILTAWACTNKTAPTKTMPTVFSPPVIVERQQDTATRITIESENVREVYPKFLGKFSFSDTILLDTGHSHKDYVDYKLYYKMRDSLGTDGLEIIPDYKTSIYRRNYESLVSYCHYPVYIVNSTNTDKIFYGKDSWVFAIQEAKENRSWNPIEAKGFDFCGNGTWAIVVKPKQFLVFLMAKYKGSAQVPMRVRLKNDESIYVSKSFLGTINPKQIDIPKGSYVYDVLKESKGKAASWLFYGATLDNENWAVLSF